MSIEPTSRDVWLSRFLTTLAVLVGLVGIWSLYLQVQVLPCDGYNCAGDDANVRTLPLLFVLFSVPSAIVQRYLVKTASLQGKWHSYLANALFAMAVVSIVLFVYISVLHSTVY